jgi:hypothetical protein
VPQQHVAVEPATPSPALENAKEKDYVFTPARIEVTEPADIAKDKIGEGEEEGTSFKAEVVFYDSLGVAYATTLWGYYLYDDKSETAKEEYLFAKKAFTEITSAEMKDLIVTARNGTNYVRYVEKKAMIALPKKIGNATVINNAEPVTIWP